MMKDETFPCEDCITLCLCKARINFTDHRSKIVMLSKNCSLIYTYFQYTIIDKIKKDVLDMFDIELTDPYRKYSHELYMLLSIKRDST